MGTQDTVEVNRPSGNPPTPVLRLPAGRPRDLRSLPVVSVPRPADADDPETDQGEWHRASGGHCRIAMGYLD
ncbi:hypothetical protein OG871_06525 [Kitasatospora sp. NBC_00374]|uniref:hypothetical protein n=1 Tax=Kitasatospora sp. NBC_00374 TaxID=2975964 RepID=UPI003252A7A6